MASEWDENNHQQFTPRDEEREWLSTSPDEIVEIQSDLHGHGTGSAACLSRAEDEKDSAALSALEAEIAAMPNNEKSTFLEARQKCPESVDDSHKRAFLWREEFDAKLAAQRLVAYWQYKRELFGPEKCFFPLTLCGALKDDMIALSQGFLNLLPVRDEHGRAIIFADPSLHDPSSYCRESMIRACWYLYHVASQDTNVRERGIILLVFPENASFSQYDPYLYGSFCELERKYLPVRFRSVHICRPSIFFYLTHSVLKLVIGERMRKRLQVHYGSKEHVLQNLSKFGLPRDRVPSVLGGDLVLNPVKFLSARMIQESLYYQKTPTPLLDVMNQSNVSSSLGEQRSILSSPEGNTELFSKDNFDTIISSLSGEANFAKATPQTCPQSSHAVSGDDACQAQSDDTEEVMAARRRMRDRQRRQDGSENEVAVNADLSIYDSGGIMAAKRIRDRQSRKEFSTNEGVVLAGRYTPSYASAYDSIGNDQATAGPENVDEAMRQNTNANAHNLHDPLAQHFVHPHNVTSVSVVSSITPDLSKLDKGSAGRKENGNIVDRVMQSTAARPISRRDDPRMNRAVAVRLANPHMSLLDALIAGGFKFPTSGKNLSDRQIKDANNITLYQRKNNLSRRLREARKGDPRMNRAVTAKLENPQMSLQNALLVGGFEFPTLGEDLCDRTIRDLENVSLFSRKNELSRRLGDLNQTHSVIASTYADRSYLDPREKVVASEVKNASQESAQAQISKETQSKHWQQENLSSCGSEDQRGQHPSVSSEEGMKVVGAKPLQSSSPKGEVVSMKRSDSFVETILELPGLAVLEPHNQNTCKSEDEGNDNLFMDA